MHSLFDIRNFVSFGYSPPFGCSQRQNVSVCFENNYLRFYILHALFSFLETDASNITNLKMLPVLLWRILLCTWEFGSAFQQRNMFCLHETTCPNHKNIEIAHKRSWQKNSPPHICPLNFENEHLAIFCKTTALCLGSGGFYRPFTTDAKCDGGQSGNGAYFSLYISVFHYQYRFTTSPNSFVYHWCHITFTVYIIIK